MSSELFDSAAVHLNQRGQLTPEQKKAYASAITAGRGGWLILLLAVIILVPIVLRFGQQLASLQGAAQIIDAAVLLGVILLSALIVNVLISIPAKMRAASAHVEARSGHVTFAGGEYRPMADGKVLRSIYGQNLLPGSYTFYCVHGTNWIVALEKQQDTSAGTALPYDPTQIANAPIPEQYKERLGELMSMRVEAQKDQTSFDRGELMAALASTNGFDQAALELNRRGQLAPQQIARLKRARGSNFRWGFLFMVLGIGAVGFIIYNHKADFTGILAVIAFFGIAALVFLSSARAENADVRSARVEMTEGYIHRFTRSTNSGRSSTTHYYYSLNNINFEVSPGAYHALIENVPYRIYYTIPSKHLVSIELVG